MTLHRRVPCCLFPSCCLCLYSSALSSIWGGFIHPNPSGLLTRPNSLHSFHSHLDFLFFCFLLFALISFLLHFFVSSLSIRRCYPYFSPYYSPSVFREPSPPPHRTLPLSADGCKSSVMSSHLRVGRDAGRVFSLSNCPPAELVLGFILDSPDRASLLPGISLSPVSHKHRQTLTSCWPGIN